MIYLLIYLNYYSPLIIKHLVQQHEVSQIVYLHTSHYRTHRALTMLWLVWFITFVSATKEALYQRSINSPDYVIPITNGDLRDFSGHRDYTSVIVFTLTDPEHQCKFCVETMPKLIGQTSVLWNDQHGDSKLLFFAVVDLGDPSNLELINGMGMTDVPHIWLFPKGSDESLVGDPFGILRQQYAEYRPEKADFQQVLKKFAEFVSNEAGDTIAIPEAFNPTQFFKVFLAAFIPIIIIKKKGAKMFPKVTKAHGWTVFLLLFILILVGGYQFTVQLGVPFVARNEHGIIYISGGQHYQFGDEVLIVGATYAALASTFVSMIWLGRYNVTQSSKISSTGKGVLMIVANIVVFILYSVLTSIVQRKEHDYPYHFLHLF